MAGKSADDAIIVRLSGVNLQRLMKIKQRRRQSVERILDFFLDHFFAEHPMGQKWIKMIGEEEGKHDS